MYYKNLEEINTKTQPNQYVHFELDCEDGRINILDSDKKYLDYLVSVDDRGTTESLNIINEFVQSILNINSESTADYLQNHLSSVTTVVMNPDFEVLYDGYGKEWVNRVGDVAVCIA